MLRGVFAIALGLGFIGGGLACSVEPHDDGPDQSCTPGQAYACTCPNGAQGAATCSLDGLPGICMCTGGTSEPTGSGTEGPDSTGGETSATTEPCVTDCSDDTTTASAETSACGPIFAGRVDSVVVPWSLSGQTGLAAGDAMCSSIDADHVCDYVEVLDADQAGEFAGMVNVTAWIHRTTVESVDGVPSAPGIGGRCVDWTDSASGLADGEWVEFTADGLVYHLDDDTFYDGLDNSHTDPLLPCLGTMRAVLCCNPACDG